MSKRPYQDDWESLSNSSSLAVERATSTRHSSPDPFPAFSMAGPAQPMTGPSVTPAPPAPPAFWPSDTRFLPIDDTPVGLRHAEGRGPTPRQPNSPGRFSPLPGPSQLRKRPVDELEAELEVIGSEQSGPAAAALAPRDDAVSTCPNGEAAHATSAGLDGSGDTGRGAPLNNSRSASSAPALALHNEPQNPKPHEAWSKAAEARHTMNKSAGGGSEGPSSKRRKG